MASKTELLTTDWIFKDNETYLSQSNWQSFFNKSLLQGFFTADAYYDGSTGTYKINGLEGINRGLHFSTTLLSISDNPGSGDCLYCVAYDNGTIKLLKFTGITQNTTNAYSFLSDLLVSYSKSIYTAMVNEIRLRIGLTYVLPLAYSIGGTVWDLKRMIPAYDKYPTQYNYVAPNENDTSVDTPYCGQKWQHGLLQIYGQEQTFVDIQSTYPLTEYHLYPVPAIQMGPSEIYIKNGTSNTITLKISLSYRDMYFDYIVDNNWVESSGYLTYSLTAGSAIAITVQQMTQEIYTSGGVNYPKSVYKITQMAKSA